MFVLFVAAAIFVAIAELGDKTQMLSLMLATRFPAGRVLLGVLIAVLALQLIAVAAGRLVGGLVPQGPLAVATGVLFIGFGVWSLRDAARSESIGEEELSPRRSGTGVVAAVASMFFLAELGDKTQVLTFTLAADPGVALRLLGPVGASVQDAGGIASSGAVWLGSTLGMMLVNGAAILLGSAVGRRVPRSVVGRVSGVLFMLFGVGALLAHLLTG